MRSLQAQLLVAVPQLPDVNFFQSVVLMIHHDEDGAFGLVLNRPTSKTISEIWEIIGEDALQNDQPINLGGPVSGPLMALHTRPEYSESEVLPGVFVATQKENLDALVRESDGPFRLFNGYSGWAGGQLEGEMDAGGWMTTPATHEYIFGDPATLWQRVTGDIGRRITSPLLPRHHLPKNPHVN